MEAQSNQEGVLPRRRRCRFRWREAWGAVCRCPRPVGCSPSGDQAELTGPVWRVGGCSVRLAALEQLGVRQLTALVLLECHLHSFWRASHPTRPSVSVHSVLILLSRSCCSAPPPQTGSWLRPPGWRGLWREGCAGRGRALHVGPSLREKNTDDDADGDGWQRE